MIRYRIAALAGLGLVVAAVVALAVPFLVELAPDTESACFRFALAGGALGIVLQAATVTLLVARTAPSPEERRMVRDLCLRLGVIGLFEAAWRLSRRTDPTP